MAAVSHGCCSFRQVGQGAHLTKGNAAVALTWNNHVGPDPRVVPLANSLDPTLEDI